MRTITAFLICSIIMAPCSTPAGDSWPRWRGPTNNGCATSGHYPIEWDPEKVLWKAEIPGKGFSTPIVWKKKIYLTTCAVGLDTVLAIDWSGKTIWHKTLGPEVAGKHRNASGSNPSPTTDGSALFACYKSGNFAAVELDGTVRWKMNLFEQYGKDQRYWDFGTSPVLTKKHVVIAEMHDGESWLAAFDKKEGKLCWKLSRDYETPREGKQGYTTPIVFTHKGTEALLVWGGQHLTAHDAADGKLLWSCGGFNPESTPLWPSVASPVISGEVAIVPCGRGDRRQPRLHGIKLGGSGDVTDTHRLWKRDDTGPFVPTPAEFGGRVYVVNDRGRIDCVDPKTGQSLWSGVFPKGRGNFYASPLIADGRLYAAREDGVIFVIRLEDEFNVLSEINLNEKIIASPIAVSDRLLIRGECTLYCVGNSAE